MPRLAFRHPLLDARFGITRDDQVFTDAELDDLIGDFVRAARVAREAGADFVDSLLPGGAAAKPAQPPADAPAKSAAADPPAVASTANPPAAETAPAAAAKSGEATAPDGAPAESAS